MSLTGTLPWGGPSQGTCVPCYIPTYVQGFDPIMTLHQSSCKFCELQWPSCTKLCVTWFASTAKCHELRLSLFAINSQNPGFF